MWDVAFSKDPQQTYLYMADGKQHEDPRAATATRSKSSPASAMADASPASSMRVHSIAVDSKGNLYTTETYEGKRLQKFVYKGLRPVTRKEQGTVWPR